MLSALKSLHEKIIGKVPSGAKRSSHWPSVRKLFLADEPECAACGGAKKLEVHHKKPFHLQPDLELDPKNLITLCEAGTGGINCHLAIGHLGDFKKFNPNVEDDAAAWKAKRAGAPKSLDSAA